jgi:hypothetical protein
MAATAKLYPSFNTAVVRTATPGLTLGGFFKLVLQSIEMARVVPESGTVTAKDMEKVRRLAESL